MVIVVVLRLALEVAAPYSTVYTLCCTTVLYTAMPGSFGELNAGES